MENNKSSDKISVVFWIDIQIFLTVGEVLKTPLCLGGLYVCMTTQLHTTTPSCRIMGSRGLLKSFLLLVLFSFVMTFFVFLLQQPYFVKSNVMIVLIQ